jgi:Enoyl-(Acyl carrier protein) reductase
VVNITATLADYANSSTPSVLTSLTKGGLASATKSLAIEYAARGIRVNAVSPGVIQTPEHAPDTYETLTALQPLGRVGQVSDIVDGILYLESSPFVTGEILHIDGARSPATDFAPIRRLTAHQPLESATKTPWSGQRIVHWITPSRCACLASAPRVPSAMMETE